MSTRLLAAASRLLPSAAGFHLVELSSTSGLRAQLLPSGALFALRHRETLLNQLLPGPAEDGLFRLLVRWHNETGQPLGWAPLTGPGLGFACNGQVATWHHAPASASLSCVVSLALHPTLPAWAWRVRLRNPGPHPLRGDVLHAQDLGLADEGAVRNNEAYVSQYLDLLPVSDERLGPVILARQNQPMAGGRRPWLATACATGAVAHCTDGWQFFGADHRLTAEPAAVRMHRLPSQRLQYESALAGLQSRPFVIPAGGTAEIVFVAAYREDHPAASTPADAAAIHAVLPANWIGADLPTSPAVPARSVFTHAPWIHGAAPVESDWAAWFPGTRRHEETDAQARLLSFFHGENTHVVSRDKEVLVARPHGHILRSGDSGWIDDGHFGFTSYAAGIFSAQAYLGNPSLARLLSVVRNQLNVARASGQRVFVRIGPGWRQLGIPSAYAMEPGAVRWLYRLEDRVIEARAWCSVHEAAAHLDLRVLSGPATDFLVTHQLVLGSQEFEAAIRLEVHEDGWISASAAPESFAGQHLPDTCFALVAVDAATLAAHGGDELLYGDGQERHGPYAVFQTQPVLHAGFALVGSATGAGALAEAVSRVRTERAGAPAAAHPPPTPVRLHGTADVGVRRLNDVLPWFTHNASIHFSAPHGLEQYGGAAWGVRDVTQGSVEWLLAAGDFGTVRRILSTVFEQQYAEVGGHADVAGCWPQWFMFAPFRFIQQTHSHGDVCLWPLKALCDYVEASNDFAFLDATVGYTDPEKFVRAGPTETLWAHCDRVIAHCESRFVAGTALINYGDGDWDDTLQPAEPSMRTRMISAWTVGLCYHTFRQFAEVARRAGQTARAAKINQLLTRIRADFLRLAMPDGVVAGFLVSEPGATLRPLLHPADQVTGIRYRLLPMTRSILAELFTPAEATKHAAIVDSALKFSDGVRLMSEPAVYHGGLEKLFKRADTAANVGREIGLQYVHAHIRYAEAMAKLGEADRLWEALQVINPVGLVHVVPTAAPRQSNVYFSSSDADFADRIEAAARWPELRAGRVPVRGGWRLYSSGPGLYLHKVRCCLLGVRESFGDVVFDPVLPRSLDGLTAELTLCGRPVTIVYHVRERAHSPEAITVNGRRLTGETESNPYRSGGLRISADSLRAALSGTTNRIEIAL